MGKFSETSLAPHHIVPDALTGTLVSGYNLFRVGNDPLPRAVGAHTALVCASRLARDQIPRLRCT